MPYESQGFLIFVKDVPMVVRSIQQKQKRILSAAIDTHNPMWAVHRRREFKVLGPKSRLYIIGHGEKGGQRLSPYIDSKKAPEARIVDIATWVDYNLTSSLIRSQHSPDQLTISLLACHAGASESTTRDDPLGIRNSFAAKLHRELAVRRISCVMHARMLPVTTLLEGDNTGRKVVFNPHRERTYRWLQGSKIKLFWRNGAQFASSAEADAKYEQAAQAAGAPEHFAITFLLGQFEETLLSFVRGLDLEEEIVELIEQQFPDVLGHQATIAATERCFGPSSSLLTKINDQWVRDQIEKARKYFLDSIRDLAKDLSLTRFVPSYFQRTKDLPLGAHFGQT